MQLTPDTLLEQCPELSSLLSSQTKVCIAFSGGCESSVLLQLLVELFTRHKQVDRLRALHINHNLQPASAEWAQHCRRECRSLGLPLRVVTVDGDKILNRVGGSLENAARNARYAVFEAQLRKDETLLQAHHADDQIETMLFRLIRGSGPGGLSGIPQKRKLGRGYLLRPLLSFTRASIEGRARSLDLNWIDDPSNQVTDHDRNYLRQQVVPQLRARWPSLHAGFRRTQGWLLDAVACSRALAETDLISCSSHNWLLDVEAISQLPAPRQRNLVFYCCEKYALEHGLPPPDYISVNRIINEVLPARRSSDPVVRWPKGKPQVQVRRYDGHLYLLPVLAAASAELQWTGKRVLKLGGGRGQLKLKRVSDKGFPWSGAPLTVRFNVAGLKIKRADRPTRTLGRLCQELRIPPWERPDLPLLFEGDCLLSVADLMIPENAFHDKKDKLYQLEWQKGEDPE